MKRKPNRYSRPRKPYESARIAEEAILIKKYGLKSKREIWKSLAKVAYFRTRAKNLITASLEEQKVFLNKLSKLGLKTNLIADALALGKEDIMKRRLQTIVFSKGHATTPNQARQLIAHRKVLIDGKAVNAPSYLVSVAEENLISLKKKEKKSIKAQEPKEEVQAQEVTNG